MAQEIFVKLWCDQHLAEDNRKIEARAVELAADGEALTTLDLCEGCIARYVAPIAALVRKFGRPPAPDDKPTQQRAARLERASDPLTAEPTPIRRSSSTQKSFACPTCSREYRSRSNLRVHMDDAHGQTLAAYETERGRSIEGDPLPFGCDDCGLRFTAGPGLASHRRAAHK